MRPDRFRSILLLPATFLFALLLPAAPPAAMPPTRESESARLHRLFEETWEFWMEDSPTWASGLGDRRWNDRWPDLSPEAQARREDFTRGALERLRGIDRALLDAADRRNAALFEDRLAGDLGEMEFRGWLMPVTHLGGIQTADDLAEELRFETVRDYADWIARMRGIGRYVDQTIALQQQGIREGRVPPRVLMERVPAQVAEQVADDPERSPFYAPFLEMAPGVPPGEAASLRSRARAAAEEVVVPAYRRFRDFLVRTYLPACRDSVGASALPRGAEYYAFRVRRSTTTALSPEEIHRTGLEEVARIRSEMDAVMRRAGWTGTFGEFLVFLRTDPRFFARSPEELLRRYRDVSKRIDPEMVRLFGKLPRMPYGVRPIPDAIAPDTTTAYYGEPAADGSRAGTYWVNLHRPEVRPLWEIEALTLHEAVPGHHLQIALAQELGELPKFRRYTGITAYTEGWGLYAEKLGEEIGLYEDPYSKFGQLTYEMWRAVRLVVDTGLHAKGWSREQAIEYFKANAPKTEHDIVNEIDRYIAWPAQALAYKIGERKILELRRRAAAALGERFDLRAFHDRVLSTGAVPLDVLEEEIDAWIAERLREPAPAAR